MGIQAKLKKVGSKFELYVGKTLKGVFGSVGAATSYLKKEFGKAFVPAAPKGAKNPWHGGTQPARGKDYVGPKSGWVQVYKGSPINAKALANHLERSHNIPAKTVKSGKRATVKVKLANISAAKRVVQDFKSELGAQGRKNPRARKTKDVYVIQQNWGYGHGWEDVNEEATRKDGVRSLKEYRENQPGTPARMIVRREKVQNPGCKVGRRKNVAMGLTVGKGKNRRFMPFRSSPDYDPSRLHDAEGKKARARKRAKAKPKKSKARKAAPVRKGSKRSSMTRYRATQNPSHDPRITLSGRNGQLVERSVFFGDQEVGYVAPSKGGHWKAVDWTGKNHGDRYMSDFTAARQLVLGLGLLKKKSNPKRKKASTGKRKIPAAFKAAAERAKSMTPAQRAAWAKKMAAAKAAKRRGR